MLRGARSLHQRRDIMLAALAVALMIGCTSVGIRPFADGTAPPTPPLRPTPSPTVAPTVTVAPSPVLPSPTAAPAGEVRTPSLRAFARHLLESSKDLKRLGRKISRASEKRDVAAFESALARTQEWVAGERRWLASNQPRECYRALHETWTSAMDKMDEALIVVLAAVESEDRSEGWRGVSLLYEAMAILETFDDSLPTCDR